MTKIERVRERKRVKSYRRSHEIPNASVNELRKIVRGVTRKRTTVSLVHNSFIGEDVLEIRLVPPVHIKTDGDLMRNNEHTQKIQEGFDKLPSETKKYLRRVWVITSE